MEAKRAKPRVGGAFVTFGDGRRQLLSGEEARAIQALLRKEPRLLLGEEESKCAKAR